MRSRLLEVLDPLGQASFLDCTGSDKSLLARASPADSMIFFLFLIQPDTLLAGTLCLDAMNSVGFFILIFVASSRSCKTTAFVSSSHCLRLRVSLAFYHVFFVAGEVVKAISARWQSFSGWFEGCPESCCPVCCC